MGIQRNLARRSSQACVFSKEGVYECFFIAILFGESKIDNVEYMRLLIYANEDVFGFKVAVNMMTRMNVFNPGYLTVKWISIGHNFVTQTELTNWSADIRTILSVNLRLQRLKRSSRDGPKRFMHIA